MSSPKVYTWPAPSNNSIALVQTDAGFPYDVIINGALAVDGIVTFEGYSREVTLTSAGNNSGVTFTITGTYAGAVQIEDIVGPNADTVIAPGLWDSIVSIKCSAAYANVSVGTGIEGNTEWFPCNTSFIAPHITIRVKVTGNITYSLDGTLDTGIITTNSDIFAPDPGMIDQTISAESYAGSAFTFLGIRITTGGGDNTGSLTATFLQQGNL